MKIVHFSDWHGSWDSRWRKLPEADLYICTGDMLFNYSPRGIIASFEERGQLEWLHQEWSEGGLRQYLGTKDAPVVVVRGNHDFVDMGPFFGGEVFEVNLDPTRTVEYCGLKIGGFRGIPFICGWADELDESERKEVINLLPDDLDVVVSHVPPKGILSDRWGCNQYILKVQKWMNSEQKPILCCFGHIHEDGCMTKEQSGIMFSNAALGYNEIEIEGNTASDLGSPT